MQARSCVDRFRLVTLGFGMALTSAPHAAGLSFETVALTGDDAPGSQVTQGGGLKQFDFFGIPAIDAAGGVGFTASLTGSGVTANNNDGLWTQAGGPLDLVAREGFGDTGLGAFITFEFVGGGLQFGRSGHAAFAGSLGGPIVNIDNDQGLWSGAPGNLDLIAREGDQAPGLAPGVSYSLIEPLVRVNGTGRVAFRGRADNTTGIWSNVGGPLDLITIDGAPAPGFAPGVQFNGLFDLALNDAGTVAFDAQLAGPGITVDNDAGVWLNPGGVLQAAIREGDAAPGTAPGVLLGPVSPGSVRINNADRVAFVASLTGAGVTGDNNSGVWAGPAAALGLVAREGDAAPGTAPGIGFEDFGLPVLNGAGETAWLGVLNGPGITLANDTGLWAEGDGGLHALALEGAPAPGTPVGVTFDEIGNPSFNSQGQVVFSAILAGLGVNITNDVGLFAARPGGETELLLRKGDLFDVDDDPVGEDLRTISQVNVIGGRGGEDGRSTPLNDAGQLAFRLQFTDGDEGVFIATLAVALTGDYDDSGQVEQGDLDIVLQNWGTANFTGNAGNLVGGGPFDGLVDQNELDGVLQNWGSSAAPDFRGTAVPEPGVVGGAALVSVLAIRRSRR